MDLDNMSEIRLKRSRRKCKKRNKKSMEGENRYKDLDRCASMNLSLAIEIKFVAILFTFFSS